jgi:hypothetical protein
MEFINWLQNGNSTWKRTVTHLIVEALGDVNSSSIREGLDDIKDIIPTLSPHVACNSSRVGELSMKILIAIIVVLVLGIIIIIIIV